MGYIQKINKVINRNRISIHDNMEKVKKNKVNIQYYNKNNNVGDLLSPIVCNYMLSKQKIDADKNVNKTKYLYGIGSIIDFGYQDATVWGSGVMNGFAGVNLARSKKIGRKLDIRAVRGPGTRELLKDAGYECPEIYGDPAVLMPLIYNPDVDKKYKVSYIIHMFGEENFNLVDNKEKHIINMKTNDYKSVIKEIKESELIISASLHGIILAESYNVPAIFAAKDVKSQLFKYYDWYESTGREDFVIASTYKAAMKLQPPPLPELDSMRERLMKVFPYDIYDCK